jgi:hypothetical protein
MRGGVRSRTEASPSPSLLPMSGITPVHRIASWNGEFLDNSEQAFAGLFQHDGMLTVGEAQLRPCL